MATSGYPEWYDCHGDCTHVYVSHCFTVSLSHISPHSPHSSRSEPCEASRNKSLLCPPGYWLCEDQTQCILRGYSFSHQLTQGFISNFCDGVNHCKDGSDEQFSQCLQVSPTVVMVLVVSGSPHYFSLLSPVAICSWPHSSQSVGLT